MCTHCTYHSWLLVCDCHISHLLSKRHGVASVESNQWLIDTDVSSPHFRIISSLLPVFLWHRWHSVAYRKSRWRRYLWRSYLSRCTHGWVPGLIKKQGEFRLMKQHNKLKCSCLPSCWRKAILLPEDVSNTLWEILHLHTKFRHKCEISSILWVGVEILLLSYIITLWVIL